MKNQFQAVEKTKGTGTHRKGSLATVHKHYFDKVEDAERFARKQSKDTKHTYSIYDHAARAMVSRWENGEQVK